jgi:hypothetical protein
VVDRRMPGSSEDYLTYRCMVAGCDVFIRSEVVPRCPEHGTRMEQTTEKPFTGRRDAIRRARQKDRKREPE